MSDKLIIAYRLADRFETEHTPAKEKIKKIEQIIIMTKDGSSAILGDVISAGKDFETKPPKEFTRPSLWDNEDTSNKGWFAIENIKRITIKAGDYTSLTGKDLLKSMSGAGSLNYIEILKTQTSN